VSPASTANPLIITGLTNGQTYTVVLQAISSNGTSTSSNSLTGTPSLPFIYSFVYSGIANVLDYIPIITSSGTLTISSSFVKVGTTYTVTVSLINFTDTGGTTDGITFIPDGTVNAFYRNIPVTIQQFGAIPLSRNSQAFTGMTLLTILPTTIPVILPTTSFTSLFLGCTNFNSDISNWNTGAVTNMSSMFRNASAFNQPIGTWNTSAVTIMVGMFTNASAFNQPIGTWNTGAVTFMDGMFNGAVAFNQPIGNWNTYEVLNMSYMFAGAVAFNQNIRYSGSGLAWNTSRIQNNDSINFMFSNATNFNNGGVPLNWIMNIALPVGNFRKGSSLVNINNVTDDGRQIGGSLT
jgi:surface protein